MHSSLTEGKIKQINFTNQGENNDEIMSKTTALHVHG